MRLALVDCIVLACIVTSLAEGIVRPKRDLAYWKNWIYSHLFGSSGAIKDITPILGSPAILVGNKENFQLYRIPGFDNILVKAVPKAKNNFKNEDTNITTTTSHSEAEKEKEPTVAIIENYLGTKTLNETFTALQRVRDMLQSGILSAQRETGEEHRKESVFVIPPMTYEVNFRPIIIKPPKIPVASFVSHIAPIPTVPDILPDLKTIQVQPILPVPITPSAQYSFKQVKDDGSVTNVFIPDSQDVLVTESNVPPPLPAFLINRIQHVFRMPSTPLPSVPNFLVQRPVAGINVPVEPSKVRVKVHPNVRRPVIKDTVIIPARRPVLEKETVMLSRLPPIIVDRLEKIAGGKIVAHRPIVFMPHSALPSRESIIEQSKSVKVQPLPSPWTSNAASTNGKVPGQQYSYKVVNNDGGVTTFSRLSDSVKEPGYYVNTEGDDAYLRTENGKVFYSNLIKDHPAPLTSKYIEDKSPKTQYTVTNIEEYKNALSRDDVRVTYGSDKENKPFLSYSVPSSSYSFQQVNNFSKLTHDQNETEETIIKAPRPLDLDESTGEDNKPPLKIGGIQATTGNSKEIELPPSPSKYSFKQIRGDGIVTYTEYDSSKNGVVFRNVKNFKNTVNLPKNSEGEGEKNIHGVEISKDPSNIFKQINRKNSQPDFLQAEDTSTRFSDKNNVKVMPHEHIRLDGTKYLCTEVHSVPASVIATMLPPVGVPPTLPKELVYIPPQIGGRLASLQKGKNSGVTLKPLDSSQASRAANTEHSFSINNPVVVSDEYKQTKIDDSLDSSSFDIIPGSDA